MSRLTVANIHFNTSGSERLEYIDGNIKLFTSGTFIFNSNVVGGASVTIKNTAPLVQDTKPGDLWWNSNTGALLIYYSDGNSSQWVSAAPQGEKGEPGPAGPAGPTGSTGPAGNVGPTGPKSLSVPLPAPEDNITIFFTDQALTMTKVQSGLRHVTSTANSTVRANLYYGTSRNSGTLITQNFVSGNTWAGNSNTTFVNSSVPANNYIWLQINNVSNTPLEYHLTLFFTT